MGRGLWTTTTYSNQDRTARTFFYWMKKIGREFFRTLFGSEPVGGRKFSLRGETLIQGLDADIECWHQIDALHSFVHWSTEADLSPRARLIWG